jgi:hypothetical protein
MARAVATNFYTPKEVSFQGYLMWARASPVLRRRTVRMSSELSKIPALGTLAPTFDPRQIHEGTLPFVKLSGGFRFPVTICACPAESSRRWF